MPTVTTAQSNTTDDAALDVEGPQEDMASGLVDPMEGTAAPAMDEGSTEVLLKPLRSRLTPRRLQTFQDALSAAMASEAENLRPLPEPLRKHIRKASADEAAFMLHGAPEAWRLRLRNMLGKRKLDALMQAYAERDAMAEDGGEKTQTETANEAKHEQMASDALKAIQSVGSGTEEEQAWKEKSETANHLQAQLNQALLDDPEEHDNMQAEVSVDRSSGKGRVQIAPNDTEKEAPVRLFDDKGDVIPGANLAHEGDLKSQFFDMRKGKNQFTGLSVRQQELIERFAATAQKLIEPWTAVRSRNDGDFSFDAKPLDQHFDQFRSEWFKVFTEETQYDEMGIPVPLTAYHPAMAELKRQLDVGHFRQYVEEINQFNFRGLFNYREILGVDGGATRHNYSLQIIAGLEVSADVGVSLEGSIQGFSIRYENDIGMWWERTVMGRTGGLGAGIGLSPIGVNALSSLGGGELNAGSASTFKYIPPSLFTGFSGITYTNGQALVGGGVSVGEMTFFDSDHSLTFDTSGIIAKIGTADVGEASATMGLGYAIGGALEEDTGMQFPELKEKELQPATDAWMPLFGGVVYFDTDETALTTDDGAVISQVSKEIGQAPDSIFRIELIGSASKVGDAAYNAELAKQRCTNTQSALKASLSGLDVDFSQDVRDKSQLIPRVRDTPRTSDIDNRQIDRSCGVIVYYKQKV